MEHSVTIGQLWKRKSGAVYQVKDERGDSSRDVFLKPFDVPDGIRARSTWKWDQAVRVEMELVGVIQDGKVEYF